jgi:excisionase family DNA binding protein
MVARCLYRHFADDGTLLYVGISNNPFNRLGQHEEVSCWFGEVATVKIEHFKTREAAMAAERKAVFEETPRYNLARPRSSDGPMLTDYAVDLMRGARNRADASRLDLLRRVASFQPTYNFSEAAAVLGMSPSAIADLVNDGKLGFIEVGRRRLITGWQLIDFIEANERRALRA